MKTLTVVKEKLGKRYLQGALILTVVSMPVLSHAEGEFIDPAAIKAAVDGIGLPALIGACVAAMLAVAVLIWGGRKVIGFFSK